jgi:OmcA/MtrC family decaheme c-type cytochrome
VVEVKFTDDSNQPLDRLGQVTPGACSASMILGWYDAAHRDYVSYTTRVQTSPITNVSATQASADSNGTWTTIALGHYTYKFRTALPAGFDQTKTTTLGIYGSRNLAAIIEKTYYDNVLYDFRPDGAAVTDTWDAFATATCNNCHDPLALHGGSRQEVKLCVLCHNQTQSVDPDTGNNVQMANMTHKIHFGPNLENGYTIIGFGQAVHDYSHITYPQDVRNCDTCHKDAAAEGYIWYTNPSRQACGSCHDYIDWATGEGHPAGPQADDSACASCHIPQGESEFDASIKGAHTIPTKSAQLKGLNLEILSVTNTAPGQAPTVTYTLKNDDGTNVDPKTLNRFRFLFGGSTTEYTQAGYLREDAGAKSTCSSGTCSYTFTGVIPADATGSFTMSADYYRNVTIDNHTETGLSVREAGQNPIFFFPVTDAQAVARRTVVDINKCNKCHNVLAEHGGQRFLVAECDICHTPDLTEDGESFHMKWMVHKIHKGEDLTRPYLEFNEVLYPGDLRNCEACHKAGTYGVPLPEGTLPTLTPNDFVPSWPPASAACLACHDTIDAAAHAYTNNAPFAEACAACHGTGREFAVTKVHAR